LTKRKSPTNIEYYELASEVRRTDVSILYRAIDKRKNQPLTVEIAAKLRLGSPDQIRDFYDRARTLASLEHANLYIPAEFGVTDSNYPFFVWTLMETTDLWDALESSLSLSSDFIRTVFRKVCDALGLACSAGVQHSIIYPSDLLFRNGEGDDDPLIGGFERELLVPEASESPQVYTLYRAPELCLGAEADERSTIYALGCLLYEAVTSKPYELSPSFTCYIAAHEPSQCLTWLQGLPFSRQQPDRSMADSGEAASLEPVIAKCLQLNPTQRYQDLVELKGDLLSTAGSVADLL